MKIAVIGCGNIANHAHIPSYMNNPEAEIVYFCDILPERAQAAVDKYGCGKPVTVTKRFWRIRPLMRSRSARPTTSTPPRHGLPTAGKHVLCEKPAARTYEEALEMQRVQHETGKVLNIGVVNRFNDSVNRIKEYIEAGKLGEVFHVYVSSALTVPSPDWAAPHHQGHRRRRRLIDWGVHFLDIVMYCCGDPCAQDPCRAKPSASSARRWRATCIRTCGPAPPKYDGVYDVDDSVTGLIRTAGPVITLNGAWAQNIGEEEMFIDFMGDKGGIRLQYGKEFTVYTTENNALISLHCPSSPPRTFPAGNDAFHPAASRPVKSCPPTSIPRSSPLASWQALYDSADQHRELVLVNSLYKHTWQNTRR